MELWWSYIVFPGDAKTSGGAQGGSSCKSIGCELVASGGVARNQTRESSVCTFPSAHAQLPHGIAQGVALEPDCGSVPTVKALS